MFVGNIDDIIDECLVGPIMPNGAKVVTECAEFIRDCFSKAAVCR